MNKGRPRSFKEKKQQVNTTIDRELYIKLNIMRNYFLLNWSDTINTHLWNQLKELEKKLQKERPKDYENYLKQFEEESKS